MKYPERLNLSNRRSNQSKMAYGGGSAMSNKEAVRSKSSHNSGVEH